MIATVNFFIAPRQDQRWGRHVPSCDRLYSGTGDIQIDVFPGAEIRTSQRTCHQSSGQRIVGGEGVEHANGEFVLPPREDTFPANGRNLGL